MAPRVNPPKPKAKDRKTEPAPAIKAAIESASAGGDGRVVLSDDNVRAAYEEERATLIAAVHDIMDAQRKVKAQKAIFDERLAEIKVPLDGAKARELELFRLAKAKKLNREWIEGYIADMLKDTRQREDDRKRETRHRGMLNIGGQGELFPDEAPLEVKDGVYWQSEGYLAYQRGEPAKAPDTCPQRFVQAFLQGWNDGQSAQIWAMGKVTPAPEPKPEQVDIEEAAELTPREKKAQEKRARESLDALSAIAEAEPELVAQVIEDHGDGFEASPEELASQTTRAAIVGAREEDEVEEAV